MNGAGLSPAGTTPAGKRFPFTGSAAPLPGTTTGVRFVDPLTKDYARNADGTFVAISPLLQRVVWSVCTKLGSSSEVPSGGIDLPDTIGEDFVPLMRSRVQEALAPLGSDIDLISIDVDVSASRPLTTIKFRDPLGTEQSVSFEPTR